MTGLIKRNGVALRNTAASGPTLGFFAGRQLFVACYWAIACYFLLVIDQLLVGCRFP
jgi:hypothetical protein